MIRYFGTTRATCAQESPLVAANSFRPIRRGRVSSASSLQSASPTLGIRLLRESRIPAMVLSVDVSLCRCGTSSLDYILGGYAINEKSRFFTALEN
jgi:hypothetical protein